MNRRNLLKFAATVPLLSLNYCTAKAFPPYHPKDIYTKKFLEWIAACTPAQGKGLVPYMANQQNTLSTIASAKLMMFYIKAGDLQAAQTVANGFIYWYGQAKKNGSKYSKGGLPSEIYLNKSQPIGDYYYASDTMLVIHAMNQLYQATQNSNYAEMVTLLGQWMNNNLFDGARRGAWFTNYGPPMHYITTNGSYNNTIHTAGDFLWLKSLEDLHQLRPREGWNERLQQALNFMATAQMPSGAWYTYFTPPIKKNESGKWFNYQGDNITISDDNLRSALAAQHFKMQKQTEQFKQWLQPYEDVFMWGYVNTDKSTPKFLPQDAPYFDVVCTGLLRSWYDKMGNKAMALKCQTMLNQLQAADGGWYWAVLQSNQQPLNAEEAIITSCWALENIA